MSGMRKKPKFSVDENVVCPYKGEFYLAKCIKIKKSKSSFQYLIHYVDWSNVWDEWMTERRIIKMTKENFDKLKIEPPKEMRLPTRKEERKSRSQELHKPIKRLATGRLNSKTRSKPETAETSGRRRGSSSTEISESGTSDSAENSSNRSDSLEATDVDSDKSSDISRENDVSDDDDSSSTTSEVSFSKRSFYLKLPSKLKFALVYDYDMVTYQKAFPKLPAQKSVKAIVDEYLAVMKSSRRSGKKLLYANDTFKFVLESFNALIDTCLLYKSEAGQFQEFSAKIGGIPSETFGAVHLLRLLAKLNDFLNEEFAAKMNAKEIERYETELKLFFDYVSENRRQLFGEFNYKFF